MTAAETWVDEVAPGRGRTASSGATGRRPRTSAWSRGCWPTARSCGSAASEAPGCTLHRSHPSDVARTEHLTFIAAARSRGRRPHQQLDVARRTAREKVGPLFDGVMKGRTMYVVPYVMGPLGSPFSKVGIEVTDSPYVVANMRIMTRMGKAALDQLGVPARSSSPASTPLGDLSPDRRFIVHFPEERLIWSVGSGYGGNALLGKKCFALRIASTMARDQGWMAEHMLILELDLPGGEVHYVAAAFPSACGKTNLAMLVSPLEKLGYKVRTVGDDIAWLRPGARRPSVGREPRGRLLRRGAGDGPRHEPQRDGHDQPRHDLHQRGRDARRRPVVGGQGQEPARGPDRLAGQALGPDRQGRAPQLALHGGRAPVPEHARRAGRTARACRSRRIVFGGRRARVAPLVFQAFDWNHGVFVGATMGSETTAAATGARRRRAARPDGHAAVLRLQHGRLLRPLAQHGQADRQARRPSSTSTGSAPARDGRFLWPGFGQNLRVLLWMIDRIKGKAAAVETPVGLVPTPERAEPRGPRPRRGRRGRAAPRGPRGVGRRGAGDPGLLRHASATACRGSSRSPSTASLSAWGSSPRPDDVTGPERGDRDSSPPGVRRRDPAGPARDPRLRRTGVLQGGRQRGGARELHPARPPLRALPQEGESMGQW